MHWTRRHRSARWPATGSGTVEDTSQGKRRRPVVSAAAAVGSGQGWFVEPTIFADVDNNHTIAQEEIFGVLSLIPTPTSTTRGIANDSTSAWAARCTGQGRGWAWRGGCRPHHRVNTTCRSTALRGVKASGLVANSARVDRSLPADPVIYTDRRWAVVVTPAGPSRPPPRPRAVAGARSLGCGCGRDGGRWVGVVGRATRR